MMPVCALFSCLAVGWFIGAKNTVAELKADGHKFGILKTVFLSMVKFVVPALILIIEIFGIFSLIFPSGKFNLNGLYITIFALVLFGILIAIYFIFLKKVNTGCNADEID